MVPLPPAVLAVSSTTGAGQIRPRRLISVCALKKTDLGLNIHPGAGELAEATVNGDTKMRRRRER